MTVSYIIYFLINQIFLPIFFSIFFILIATLASRSQIRFLPARQTPLIAMGIIVVFSLCEISKDITQQTLQLIPGKIFSIVGVILSKPALRWFMASQWMPGKNVATVSKECAQCQTHMRNLWGPVPNPPKMYKVDACLGFRLNECEKCSTQWLEYRYDPNNSFSYMVKWTFGQKRWHTLRKAEGGKSLQHWHQLEIRRGWKSLSTEELNVIDFHRKCTGFRDNPIDTETSLPLFTTASHQAHTL